MTAPIMVFVPADEPDAATIEWLLDQTRNGYESDYRAWGRAAAALATEFPDLLVQLAVEALTSRARGRVTREARRTLDGITRVLADAETGQVSAWPDWTDPVKVRVTGSRIEREGQQKVRLGQRMQAVADAMDIAPAGTSGRDAWAAIGGDPSLLDEAEEVAA